MELIELRDFEVVREIERKAIEFTDRNNLPEKLCRPLFVRGLGRGGDSIFIGISPGTVLELDVNTKSLLSHMQISHDPRVCVHGLAATQI
jgi:hypothetical protein